MKKIIDRVIFCLNNNENYIDFWNYISKVYYNKFNVTPTLFFSGLISEYQDLLDSGRLSKKFGDIFHLNRVFGIPYEKNLDWTCTWSLFYGASLFPNEVCMLSGIDQVPLCGDFFEKVKNINPRKNYIVGFSDAYGKESLNLNTMEPGTSFPSSHHVGLGNFYKILYGIDANWETELNRVFNDKEVKKFFKNSNFWGFDECYSTFYLKKYLKEQSNTIPINLITNFNDFWGNRRIDRSQGIVRISGEILENVKKSKFSEYHCSRPFNKNLDMEKLYECIPFVNNNEEIF